MAGVLSSLRYLLADFIGDDSDETPLLPDGLPESVVPIAGEAVDLLIGYQSPAYAQLYLRRLRRFVGRRTVDETLFCDIARLMAMRMSYEDPIRIAQLKLAEFHGGSGSARVQSTSDVRKFRYDELVGALPAAVADPLLGVIEWMGWLHKPVKMRFTAASAFGIRRLKIEAGLRRWRLFSVRYAKERVWVERWLHMIDRSLTQQPQAALEIARTATMVQGYGDGYRQGEADWHLIINSLVKPTFDGVLKLSDVAGAVAEARAAALPDPRQAVLKRKIAEIRARVQAVGANAAAG